MEKHVLYSMLQVMQWLDVRLAQLDRAFGYGPKGRGFESSNAREALRKSECFFFDHIYFVLTDLWVTAAPG